MFGAVGDDELIDTMGQMHGIANAAMRILLAGIVEVDQRELWRADGVRSTADWVELRYGVSAFTARSWVRVARGLVFCPTVAESFEAGHLSWDQLVSCVELVAHAGGDEALVAADAVGESAAQLDRLAREARRVSREEANERHRRRHLRFRHDRDLAGARLSGWLPAEEAAVAEAALRRHAEVQPLDSESVPVLRSIDERQADAFVELCSADLAAGADPDLATVVVHVDAQHVTSTDGLATMESGAVIALDTFHRLACDGRMQTFIDDAFGVTVHAAKVKHAVPPWLRRKIRHRDGGCRFPGCGRRTLVHVHHIAWWTRDGGLTEEQNLTALCPFHHRLVHEGGWTIDGDPAGRLTFTGPTGRILTTGPPRVRDDVRLELGLPVPA